MSSSISSLQIGISCLSSLITAGGVGTFLIFVLKSLENRIDSVEGRLNLEKINRAEDEVRIMAYTEKRTNTSVSNIQKKIADLFESLDSKKTDKDICKIVSTNIEKIYSEQQKITQEICKNQIDQGKELARMATCLNGLIKQLEK